MEIATLVLGIITLISCISIIYLFIQQSKKIQELKENVNMRLTTAETNIKEESDRMLRELKSNLNIVEAQVERIVKATHANGDLTIQSKNETIELHTKSNLLLNQVQENVSKLETKLAKDLVEDMNNLLKDMQDLYTKHTKENEIRINTALNKMQELSKNTEEHLHKIHQSITEPLNLS